MYFSSNCKAGAKMLDYAKGYNGGDMKNHVPNTQPKTIRHQPNYPRLKLILIRIISCVCIVLGAMSIIVQVSSIYFKHFIPQNIK